jgi:hypothetical protein
MVPTLLIVGFVFGRWWRLAAPIAILGWPVWLIVAGVGSGPAFALGATVVAVFNVAVGVLAYHLLRKLARHLSAAARRATTHH